MSPNVTVGIYYRDFIWFKRFVQSRDQTSFRIFDMAPKKKKLTGTVSAMKTLKHPMKRKVTRSMKVMKALPTKKSAKKAARSSTMNAEKPSRSKTAPKTKSRPKTKAKAKAKTSTTATKEDSKEDPSSSSSSSNDSSSEDGADEPLPQPHQDSDVPTVAATVSNYVEEDCLFSCFNTFIFENIMT